MKRKILALTTSCIDLRTMVQDKDKLIKNQQITLKEALYAGDSQKIAMLKQEYEKLARQAAPHGMLRGVPSISNLNRERLELSNYLDNKRTKLHHPISKSPQTHRRNASNILASTQPRNQMKQNSFHTRSRSYAAGHLKSYAHKEKPHSTLGVD